MNAMQIKRSVTALSTLLILTFAASDWESAGAASIGAQDKPAPPQEKMAEEVYKNIQIFKGLPASRLMGGMNFFARSLGVDCAHCHVPNEFEKDDKPTKQTARKMYEMVRICQKELGNTRISCFMCHRGQVQPEPPPESWKAEADELMKQGEQDKRPVEQVYKNIQRLKGVPAGRWMLIMQMFSKSLGVKCDYCHVPDAFDKDDKPAKQTARKMLGMVGAIAREIYKGPTSINCYTCHRGQPQPVSFPPPASDAKPAESKPPELTTTGPMPSVDEVLDRFIKAVGGKRALEKLSSRVMKGTLSQGGMTAPLEIFEQAPNKMLVVFHIPGSSVSIGTDGVTAWEKSPQIGVRVMDRQEAEFTTRICSITRELNIKNLYTKLEVKGRAKLGEREAYVIEGSLAEGSPERLYFDTQTWLLVRQDLERTGKQGKISLQFLFEDYREVDGVKLPFMRKWSQPSNTIIQKFDEIKHNVAIDSARFNKPSGQ